MLNSKTECVNTAHGRYYITIDENQKLTCHVSSTDPCIRAAAETITELINLMILQQIKSEDIIVQLKDIQCCPTLWANSTADAIGKVLETYAVQ